MLDEDNTISKSFSEAVEKISTNQKDYRKYSFMYFTLYSHGIQRATMYSHTTGCKEQTNIQLT